MMKNWHFFLESFAKYSFLVDWTGPWYTFSVLHFCFSIMLQNPGQFQFDFLFFHFLQILFISTFQYCPITSHISTIYTFLPHFPVIPTRWINQRLVTMLDGEWQECDTLVHPCTWHIVTVTTPTTGHQPHSVTINFPLIHDKVILIIINPLTMCKNIDVSISVKNSRLFIFGHQGRWWMDWYQMGSVDTL